MNSIITKELNIPVKTEFFVMLSPLLFTYGNWRFHSIYFILILLFFLKDKILFNDFKFYFPNLLVWVMNLLWGAYIIFKSPELYTGIYFYIPLYITPFVIFILIQNIEFNNNLIRKIFIFIILSGVIISIFHIISLIEYGFAFEKRIVSKYLWPDNNILAAYYMIVLFVTLSHLMNSKRGKSKIFYIVSIIFVLFAIFLTQTRGVWLSVVIALSIYILKKPKLFIPISVIFAILIFFFSDIILTRILTIKNFTTDLSSLGRLQAWIGTLSLLKDNYLTGYGFDAWMNLRDNVYGFYLVPVIHSHNTYLNNLLEIGLIGCIFYYYFFIKSIIMNFKIWRSPKNDVYKKYSDGLFLSFIGLAVTFMFEPYLSTFSSSVVVIWFLIALSFRLNNLISTREKSHS